MAIATSIDGNNAGGMNQLFDLLAVVSDPQAYNEKLKVLQDAADRNQKYVELVAPAADIIALRDELRAKKAEADAALKDAKAEAALIIDEAKQSAGGLIEEAMQKALAVKADADRLVYASKEAAALADASMASANAMSAKAEKMLKDATAAMASVKVAEEGAASAMSDANKLRDGIIAKHKAFIESLG